MNANAVALEHNQGVISAVQVRSLQGKTLEVRARKTILAMGGLENARFLLNTEDSEAAALGNSNSAGISASYVLQMIFEPSPCRESRVTLSDERDSLGLRRLHLHWVFNMEDFERLSATIDHIVACLGQFGLGRIKMQRSVNTDSITARKSSGLHHMGTTRMSESPDMGVVDKDCRVHHCQNLFVAGSSVFPTVGFSNPTLTIVALAARLADTIEDELQS